MLSVEQVLNAKLTEFNTSEHVRNSETTDQAKDGGKKSFEVPSAREKVKETRNPKARGE
jgi:hypothetical protein